MRNSTFAPTLRALSSVDCSSRPACLRLSRSSVSTPARRPVDQGAVGGGNRGALERPKQWIRQGRGAQRLSWAGTRAGARDQAGTRSGSARSHPGLDVSSPPARPTDRRRACECREGLDALFAERQAATASVDQATQKVALLQGQLRAEHLKTHLLENAILTPAQVEQYARLRGYGSTPGTPVGGDAAPAPVHKHH